MNSTETKQPAFAPFRWVEPSQCRALPADHVMNAIGQIRDLSAGACLLVQMLERDELEREFDDGGALFATPDRGTLLRLAVAASHAAAGIAEELQGMAAEPVASDSLAGAGEGLSMHTDNITSPAQAATVAARQFIGAAALQRVGGAA